MPESKLYKVVTGRQEVEMVRADTAELNENSGRLNLTLDGALVGSYVGYSSMSIVDATLVGPTDEDDGA